MARKPNIRKVDASTAILLQKHQNVIATEVIVTINETGKQGRKTFNPFEVDMLAATFYKKGARLFEDAGVLCWEFDNVTYKPDLTV